MSDFVPAHDLDAEAAVLASCLLDPEAFDDVDRVLDPAHFYADANRRVYEAISALRGKGFPVDLVTVAKALRDAGRLEQVGGTPYLAQLQNATPAVANVVEHAEIVRGCWRKRAAVLALQRRLVELRSEDGPSLEELDEWVARVGAELDGLSSGRVEETNHHVADLVRDEMLAIHERSKVGGVRIVGVPTGFRELDRKLLGLERGSKYVVCARPGIGKTAFLLSVARAVAGAGHGVVLVSVEMPAEQLTQRLLAQVSGLDMRAIRTGKLAPREWDRLQKAALVLEKLPIVVEESGTMNPRSIRAAVLRGKRKIEERSPGTSLGFVGLDYLQLVHTAGPRRGQSREQEVAEVSAATTQLAKDLRVPLVELSQLNRKAEERPDKRPQLSDLRDSGAIEQDAYAVLGLYRDDYYRAQKGERNFDGKAEILVLKMRNGETGRVVVDFDGPSTAFCDPPPSHDERFHDEF